MAGLTLHFRVLCRSIEICVPYFLVTRTAPLMWYLAYGVLSLGELKFFLQDPVDYER